MKEVRRVCIVTGRESVISIDLAMRELARTATVAESGFVLTMLCAERVLLTETHSYRLLPAEVLCATS